MSDSKPKNDEMELEGQLVAGSGTAEGYSREGSDVDGRLSHVQVEDPTRGAKVRTLLDGAYNVLFPLEVPLVLW